MAREGSEARLGHMEQIVSLVLRSGVLLSAIWILAGTLLYLLEGERPVSLVRLLAPTGAYPGVRSLPYPHTLAATWVDTIHLSPLGIMMSGVLLLILTPVARVAVSLGLFLGERDHLYALITACVLTVLLSSFLLAPWLSR